VLPDDFRQGGTISTAHLYRDAQGATYQLVRGHTHPNDDRAGDWWPGNLSGMSRFIKWDAQGRIEWAVGRQVGLPFDAMPPNQFAQPMHILGETHDCLVVQDRFRYPGSVWTKDGLCAGYVLEGRADDGLPADVYKTGRGGGRQDEILLGDQICVSLITAADGTVYWSPNGKNNSPIYRITGWENWERRSGRLRIEKPASHSAANGTGLRGEYFANPALAGVPQLTRTDAAVWFGSRSDGVFKAPKPRPWFSTDETTAIAEGKPFSARWIGTLDARFHENYTLTVQLQAGSTARLWLNEVLIAERKPGLPDSVLSALEKLPPNTRANSRKRAEETEARKQSVLSTEWLRSQPVRLTPGTPHRLRLEFTSPGTPLAHIHLLWESASQERQHIPTSQLHPAQ
jgi:hypothetical protein